MLFTVIKIENKNDLTLVTGSTTIGYIKGAWDGDEAPVIGKKYQIELDFPTVERSAVTITNADTSAKMISGKTFFTGVCENYDEICYVRFSVDGLEMLDIIDGEEFIKKDDHISFSFPFENIGIYPYSG